MIEGGGAGQRRELAWPARGNSSPGEPIGSTCVWTDTETQMLRAQLLKNSGSITRNPGERVLDHRCSDPRALQWHSSWHQAPACLVTKSWVEVGDELDDIVTTAAAAAVSDYRCSAHTLLTTSTCLVSCMLTL